MNPIVYHIVSGHAWFSGIVLLAIAVFVDISSEKSTKTARWRRFENLFWLAGILLMALSSVAAPIWLFVWLLASLCIWLLSSTCRQCERTENESGIQKSAEPRKRPQAGWLLLSCLAVAVVVEIPYQVSPNLKPTSVEKITIIGDSVTAGIGGNETSERWPEILKRLHGIEVQDISHVGETASSAVKRLRKQIVDSPLVVIEIGGNDILGTTSVADFDGHLNELLTAVCADNRQVIMFELPLPPFFHGYGYVQRRLARRHNVHMLPKTTFLAAIGGSESTLDSIHLSQEGHNRMAAEIWAVIAPAAGNGNE